MRFNTLPSASSFQPARAISILALMSLGVSCSADPVRDRSGVEVTDSDGVELLHTLNASLDTMRVTLVEEVRIGRTESSEQQLFSVRGIVVDGLGRVYVSDGGTRSVRVYDRTGSWVRDAGGPGKGPGEFENIREPVLYGDTLGVLDGSKMHFALFDTSGTLLGSLPVQHAQGSLIVPFRGGPTGWTVARAQFPGGGSSERGTLNQDTLLFAHMDGQSLASLAQLTRAQLDSALTGVVPWPMPPTYDDPDGDTHSPLFQGEMSVAYDDSGRIYLSNGYPYDIHVYDTSGRLVRRVRREHEPRAVSHRDVDEWLRLIEERMPRSGPSEGGRNALARERQRAQGPHADHFPVIGRLLASATGELWAQRSDVHFDIADYTEAQSQRARPSYWDAFGSDGRFEFTVKLPPRFRPMWIERRAVVGVQRDHNDVETVVRYRLSG